MGNRQMAGSDPAAELLKRLEYEHDIFYCGMVARPSEEVYHECGRIQFHECIYEYFLYCDGIREDYVEACLCERDIFASLYHLYLEQETFRASTWEEIDALMDAFVQRQGIRAGEAA